MNNNLNFKNKFLFWVGVFILMDWFFWGHVLWKIPNESSWGTDFFYNYEYEKRRVLGEDPGNPRVVLLGSSVAGYSFDPETLRHYLAMKGLISDVRLLAHAGFTPIDAYAQRKEILEMKPTIIVYPLNFVDFRIFRSFQIFPEKPLLEVDESVLISDSLNPIYAPQAKYSYPFRVLIDFYPYYNWETGSMFLSSSLFPFYRYREIAYDNLKHLYNHRYTRNTSYYWYQGVQIPERVSTLGWTGKRFSFGWNQTLNTKGFYVQIVPELLRSGEVLLEFKSGELREEKKFMEPGWKKVQLKNFPIGSMITCEISKTWKPVEAGGDRFDYAREDMGVRLQETFGLEFPERNAHTVRQERLEDLRFRNLSEPEYKEYFQFRLLQDRDIRPGLVTMSLYKEAKERLHRENFRPFFQYRYLKQFLEFMHENNVQVLFILNPENPYSLAWYKTSDYLKDEKAYLLSLEKKGIVFYDLLDYLPGSEFGDYHHLTYGGMKRMTPVYGDKIKDMVR